MDNADVQLLSSKAAKGSVAARLLEANFDPKVLRPNDVLQNREWIQIDEAVNEVAVARLRVVSDLVAAGLVLPIENALGTTVVEYEKMSDMTPAEVNMSGITEGERDRMAFDLGSIALPVSHKDFSYNIRALASSRRRGQPLDTTTARVATRKVAEKLEDLVFLGEPNISEGAAKIYGLTTQPNIHTADFGTNGKWNAGAKTGSDILADVLTILAALRADHMNGPYWVYVSNSFETKLDDDFKALGTQTIRQRIEQISEVTNLRVADRMPADSVLIFQADMDVIKLALGFMPMAVQWEEMGGMKMCYKVMSILSPLIRADYEGHSGIFWMRTP